jgi:hypothetical protein
MVPADFTLSLVDFIAMGGVMLVAKGGVWAVKQALTLFGR